MHHSYPVADPEGVHWVPWNPSFEELPSKILCVNILRTRRPHWSYALQLHIAITHVCQLNNFLYQELDARMAHIISEASERIRVLFV